MEVIGRPACTAAYMVDWRVEMAWFYKACSETTPSSKRGVKLSVCT